MSLTAADARRWLQGFEAAEQADREEKRMQGPRPDWSIALSLSLLKAAQVATGGRSLIDPRQDEQDEAVRRVWDRLRLRLLP